MVARSAAPACLPVGANEERNLVTHRDFLVRNYRISIDRNCSSGGDSHYPAVCKCRRKIASEDFTDDRQRGRDATHPSSNGDAAPEPRRRTPDERFAHSDRHMQAGKQS